MKKIYIAGPDVFSPYAKEFGDEYKKICREHGFIGLYPLDNECDDAFEIFRANLDFINEADYVVANLNCFRGMIMDDGTAFEIGYACAKGKPIFGYMDDTRSMVDRFGSRDMENNVIEDFGFPINLMIASSVKIIEGTFEDCVKAIR